MQEKTKQMDIERQIKVQSSALCKQIVPVWPPSKVWHCDNFLYATICYRLPEVFNCIAILTPKITLKRR
jgi:hypothetical protein